MRTLNAHQTYAVLVGGGRGSKDIKFLQDFLVCVLLLFVLSQAEPLRRTETTKMDFQNPSLARCLSVSLSPALTV